MSGRPFAPGFDPRRIRYAPAEALANKKFHCGIAVVLAYLIKRGEDSLAADAMKQLGVVPSDFIGIGLDVADIRAIRTAYYQDAPGGGR